MSLLLENDRLSLHLDLPEENYQSTRFDWTGKIVQVIYRGKTIAGKEKAMDQQVSDGLGFYNEFGFDQPIGFEATPKGDWFHKIGIGLLKKQEEPYHFSQSFEVQPASIDVVLNKNEVVFTCVGANYRGYGYQLTKSIQLLADGFSIHYQLLNTGNNRLKTNEYVHNFISIDETAIDSNYQLEFPFVIQPNQFIETVNPESAVRIGEKELRFNHSPSQAFYFSNMTGYREQKASWKLFHLKEQLAISELTNFNSDTVNLWGTGHVICPELFKQIDIAPGASDLWTRRYKIEEL